MNQRFQTADNLTEKVMIVLGLILGFSITQVAPKEPKPLASMAWMFLAAVVLGGVAALAIRLVFKKVFPDGIPKSPTTGLIAPAPWLYTKIALGYFGKYCLTLFGMVACGVVDYLYKTR